MPREIVRRAIFLDRDGVLIRTNIVDSLPIAIRDGDFPEILDGVEEACALLHEAGFLLVMITNQPDVATGKVSRAFVEQTNRYLAETLKLDDSRVCYHSDRDRCLCRKPLPGLLHDAAGEFHIDLLQSYMVGDRWRDVDAGYHAGCHTVYLDCGYQEPLRQKPDKVCKSLLEAVRWILVQ